ncbi:alpha-galactosidase [Geothrix limicola]|uniref:Alpha-galactosidase n=1 Tax=Geothrix limicola TaxID=2927978 RepID=A0ABQ5QG36_9BACT|nr:alpha-galactosidase [Geothrix limicola]GLH73115.1 alpha-galactosidase [Geothrix limicola]
MRRSGLHRNLTCGLAIGLAVLALRAEAPRPLILHTAHTTLFLQQDQQVRLRYFGPRLADADLCALPAGGEAFHAAYGDQNAFGGLAVTHDNGDPTLDLACTGSSQVQEATGSILTTLEFKDRTHPFYLSVFIRAHQDSDTFDTWTRIRHEEGRPLTLHRADSAAMLFDHMPETAWVTSFPSSWASEGRRSGTALGTERSLTLENRAGVRGAFGTNPSFLLSLDGPAAETTGRVIAGALAWSGAWHISLRRDVDGLMSLEAGLNAANLSYHLKPRTPFETPHFLFTFSAQGKGQASRNLHRWARKVGLRDGDKLRPILLNSWEGAYFTFDEARLLKMMDGVKTMGGEMFVVDDGWFGNGAFARDDDKRGLGDWQVNATKLPHGLSYLAKEAESRGLKFGLWVEPEMANTESQLVKDHPDWILQTAGRPLNKGRGGTQVVLDLSNPKVQDFIVGFMDKLLTEHPGISYIKWDANADFLNVGSTFLGPQDQSHIWVEYTRGLYSVLGRIQAKHPAVLFKDCASGGGRMDYGNLAYAHEFWTSDNTDALQRLFIQWSASHVYPANAMASHVTVVPNHTTGRTVPLKFRFDVAMTGRLGFELDPAKMSAEDLAFSKSAVDVYKGIRPVVQQGDLYRLLSPFDGPFAALMYVAEDRGRAVVFSYSLRHLVGQELNSLRLQGLDPEATYTIRELNGLPKRRHSAWEGRTFSGRTLLEMGLPVDLNHEYDSAVFELVKVQG